MRSLGIDFEGSDTIYVVITDADGTRRMETSGRIVLGDEREATDLRAFHRAVSTLLHDTKPDVIGMKKKPHGGGMSAGAAAIKMEALVLIAADSPVKLFTPQHLSRRVTYDGDGVYKYLHDAARAAIAAL